MDPRTLSWVLREAKPGIMNEKPKNLKESILDSWGKTLILAISIVSAASSLVLFWYFWQIYGDIQSGRTIVFTVLTIQELVYIFAYRNLRHSIFGSGNFFANKPLFGTVALGFVQQFAALYVPFLNNILGVVPLHFSDWALVFIVALAILIVVETARYLMRQLGKRTEPLSFKNLLHVIN